LKQGTNNCKCNKITDTQKVREALSKACWKLRSIHTQFKLSSAQFCNITKKCLMLLKQRVHRRLHTSTLLPKVPLKQFNLFSYLHTPRKSAVGTTVLLFRPSLNTFLEIKLKRNRPVRRSYFDRVEPKPRRY
jgi:hypothetical protein